jgi:hypothetical protein
MKKEFVILVLLSVFLLSSNLFSNLSSGDNFYNTSNKDEEMNLSIEKAQSSQDDFV